MSGKSIKTLEVRNHEEWRSWLREHHELETEIWLVFNKRHTGLTVLSYNDCVEEALCFGWIDSLIRRLDEDRYARKFTPRSAKSKWSTANRRRYADLQARGLLEAAGLRLAPTHRSGDAPRPSALLIPPYIEQTLRTKPRAWRYFEQLAPSDRRMYLGWIDSAKREETRKKRLSEALSLLAAGRKLGLK
jgi:uncharacterized protein YdeI (YjbR/CyaY-like superfamily)